MSNEPQKAHCFQKPPAMDSSSQSVSRTNSAASSSKRRAPSLLPSVELLFSSPALTRPLKRRAVDDSSSSTVQPSSAAPAKLSLASSARLRYPTPCPTSSTGILSSSPPTDLHASFRFGGPGPKPHPIVSPTAGFALMAAASRYRPRGAASLPTSLPDQVNSLHPIAEHRSPLVAVPTVELPENGEMVLMGRSSNSSNYQLSTNCLVSRVHVKARYLPPVSPLDPPRVEVLCTGWNGLNLHCQGRTWELSRGDSFTSETDGSHIILDVQGARIMIQWPRREHESLAQLSDSSWGDSPQSALRVSPRRATPSPQRTATSPQRASAPTSNQSGQPSLVQSSSRRQPTHITSPESPTPHRSPRGAVRLRCLLPDHKLDNDADIVRIYEDPCAEESNAMSSGVLDPNSSHLTEIAKSFASEPSDLDDSHDPDEENDPIVLSFGPFGANISSRFASLGAAPTSPDQPSPPKRHRPSPVHASSSINALSGSPRSYRSPSISGSPVTKSTTRDGGRLKPASNLESNDSNVANHVINQLAFSRLSSTPMSIILNNLPVEARQGLTETQIRAVMDGITCVGSISRQGKDAAGKALESEFYYIPEADDDGNRRAAVVDGLRKPTLRNCRKQHKQYYWKRPRTP